MKKIRLTPFLTPNHRLRRAPGQEFNPSIRFRVNSKMKKYETFMASFKLILKKGKKILILTERETGYLDFPGGRIEKKETTLPIKELFKREVGEEVGKRVKYKILGPVMQYRRYDKYREIYVLVTVYEAKYLGGEIKLSGEHNKYEWADPKKLDLKTRKFSNEEEYLAKEEYFKKLTRI
ncbi:MAG: NUDIX domain-containing protein [bacterium]